VSLIFLSHSSRDDRAALALKRWLVEQRPELANEIFLDIDPQTGLRLGGQWGSQLVTSNSRCEYLICLLSKGWLESRECTVEFRTAEGFGKRILIARLEDTVESDITSHWQRCDLFAGGAQTTIEVPGGPPVAFNTAALDQLKKAIEGTGVGPENFVWPPRDDPRRAPYRGWEPFENIDAGAFFGRDAAIARGLDELRAMRFRLLAQLSGRKSLFVVLGPSGSGKSSFLRAGLIPRLQRDDRRFTVLGIVRPERNPLTGVHGFAAAIEAARDVVGLPPIALGDIKTACESDPDRVYQLLVELQTASAQRVAAAAQRGDDKSAAVAPADAGQESSVPTLVLPLDQAEELFSADAGPQADQFLGLIADVLGRINAAEVGLIVAATIRTDRYEAMQNHSALKGLDTELFDELKPMPAAEFRQVITGPAARAGEAGQRLTIAPDLVTRLLADAAEGADTLPLLALTLARLYADYARTGELTLANYEAMGGMRRVVQSTVDETLATDPGQRAHQLELLRAAFIPWLATINPDNDQPMRRVARYSDLPQESRPLIDALVEKRLLVRDERDGQVVVEVALESLLRQWDDLAGWLREERQNLKTADDIERNAAAWAAHNNDPAWLLTGTRLTDAETLANTTGFSGRLAGAHDYLAASRQAENERLAKEDEQRQAEVRHARARARYAAIVAVVAIVGAIAAVVGFIQATHAKHLADERTREALSLRLTSQGQAILAGIQAGGDVRALQQILVAPQIASTADSVGGLLTALTARRDTLKIISTPDKMISTPAAVKSVAISPDGHRIVSSSWDSTLRLWNADTGAPVGAPLTLPFRKKGGNFLTRVAFSPDGRRIVSGSNDDTVRIWDADTHQQIGAPLTGHTNEVTSVAFSPDGRRIVSGSNDDTVRIWDADTHQQIGAPLTGHTLDVTSVAFSPDGRRIVSGSIDATVRIWDADTHQQIGAPLTAPDEVTSVAFSPDGRRIVSGSNDATVRIWDADTHQQIGAPLTGHTNEVTSVVFSPDGRRIVSGSNDDTLRIWDADTHQQIGAPLTAPDEVTSVVLSPDGRRIVSGSNDATVRIWDADPDQQIGAPLTAPDEVHSVAFSPDGRRIVSSSEDDTVRIWDADTHEQIGTPLTGHTNEVTSVAFSPDGQRIVSGSYDKTVRIWDADTHHQIGAPLTGHTKQVSGVAFSPDGRRIVSGNTDATVRIWDADTHHQIGAPLTGHTNEVTSVAFSPDGRRIASGSYDDTVRIWDADTHQQIGAPLTGDPDTEYVISVAFSPDGRRIVSGNEDNTVRIWDADTHHQIGAPLTGHTSAVAGVAFSPDGRRIASGSYDETLRLWDADTGAPLGPPLTGHTKQVSSVAFSPDGRRIASGSWDRTLRLWPGPAAWPDLLCDKLTANMSYKQWRDWVSPAIGYIAVCPGLPIAPD
jgi:WD40 repeat protein